MKILSYIFTPIYLFSFYFLLIIFHPVQVVCRRIWGSEVHKKSVDILNFFIVKSYIFIGAKVKLKGNYNLPTDRPLIIVSNHQSTYDVPVVVWLFRRNYPKFISKMELAKNIPSISYNLRESGAALIDRKNGSQSIKEIIRLGRLIEKNNYSACIFPEGTRTKTGKLRKFQEGGLKTLLKASPSALIVPFVIDGNVKLHKYGSFPLSFGETLKYTVLEPIEPKDLTPKELIEKTEAAIKRELGQ